VRTFSITLKFFYLSFIISAVTKGELTWLLFWVACRLSIIHQSFYLNCCSVSAYYWFQ